MARIRTIKPEFFVSAQIADVSPTCRLLFIGMWLFCDDAGIHPASVRQLKMEVFPGDSFGVDDVQAMVDELLRVGLLIEYEAGDGAQARSYWQVTGWHHQKIERPRFQYPQPNSTTCRRHVADTSTTPRSLTVPETTVPETTKPKRTRRASSVSVVFPDNLDTPEFRAAWQEWETHRREIRSPLTDTQSQKQLARFAEWGADRAIAAIGHTIEKGWRGIREPDPQPSNGRAQKTGGGVLEQWAKKHGIGK